jgi:hypothetical protein
MDMRILTANGSEPFTASKLDCIDRVKESDPFLLTPFYFSINRYISMVVSDRHELKIISISMCE